MDRAEQSRLNRVSELVEDHRNQVEAYVVRQTAQQLRDEYGFWHETFCDLCESPAEMVFASWWFGLTWFLDPALALDAQREIEAGGRSYRLDFVITCSDRPLLRDASQAGTEWQAIAVEIDGHAFHERTREQVITRDQRDRDLQAAGIRVFHFSFHELTTDPRRVVGEVLSAGLDQVFRLQRAAGRLAPEERSDG